MALCEELQLLDIYFDRVGSGMEDFAQKWFDAIQITLSFEERLPDESNKNLWSPVVNKDDSTVELADRNAGRAKNTSTYMLHLKEFEGKEELARITRKRALMDNWRGWVAMFLNLEKEFKFKIKIPATGGRFL